jgi:hypothetical protein
MRNDTIDPREIRPNPWNTNVVSHEAELKIRESLRRHGFFRPVLVRELDDGSVQSIGGWHRVEQAVHLDFSEVPIWNLGKIDDARAMEIGLLDNARYGHDDALKMASLLEDLDDIDITAVMPWSDHDVAAFTASLSVDISGLDLDDAPMEAGDMDTVTDAPTKDPKTHEILRFKLTLADAARARALIGGVMKAQGFTQADELTNAGDALMHILSKEVDDG